MVTDTRKRELQGEILKYSKCLSDITFALRNFQMMDGNYIEAEKYAKEYTKANLDVYGTETKNYTYALMLEAQAKSKIRYADHTIALGVINEAIML